MKVLHIVKTSNGANWAAWQAAELVRLGMEVHAAVPSPEGLMMREWRQSGTTLHFADLDFPVRRPWRLASVCGALRALVRCVRPDLIHTHFVGPALVARLALGNSGPARLFQVPGPLHLEHALYREADLRTAGARDFWIGSSRYIASLYRRAGVARDRLFLSYYGTRPELSQTEASGFLRRKLHITGARKIVGNINYIYAPKRHAGQFAGLKAHEDVIDALALVLERRHDAVGVLVGSAWGPAANYEHKLRERARIRGAGRILMPGYFSPEEVRQAWPDFDCAVHVPLSENCGGVVEPLLARVPVVAGTVGGLPEVVMDGVTGTTTPIRNPCALASAILRVLEDEAHHRKLAVAGQQLAREMFDVRRTSREIQAIYEHVANGSPRPEVFDPRAFALALKAARDAERENLETASHV